MKSSPPVSLLPMLLSISKSTRTLMGLKLAEIGLHSGQDELLLALSPKSGTSVSLLAERLGVRPSTVSKMVDILVQAGQVVRAKNPRDARRTVICITPSGIEMQGRIIEVWLRFESDFQEINNRARVEQDLKRVQDIMAAHLRKRR